MAAAFADDPEAADELRRRAATVREVRDADRGVVLGEGPAATAARAPSVDDAPADARADATVTGFLRALEDVSGDGR